MLQTRAALGSLPKICARGSVDEGTDGDVRTEDGQRRRNGRPRRPDMTGRMDNRRATTTGRTDGQRTTMATATTGHDGTDGQRMDDDDGTADWTDGRTDRRTILYI